MWNTIGCTNIEALAVLEGDGGERGVENIFKEIMSEINLHSQKLNSK